MLEELTEQGLDGVEVWHPSHSAEQIEQLSSFAADRGLLMTGGSDFHGMYARTIRPLGSTSVADEQVEALLAYKDKKVRARKDG